MWEAQREGRILPDRGLEEVKRPITVFKNFAQHVADWTRKNQTYTPDRVTSLRKKKPEPEPKETMIVAGMKVVLDASPYKLKKTEYP